MGGVAPMLTQFATILAATAHVLAGEWSSTALGSSVLAKLGSQPSLTDALHVTPNRSVSIPNPALHADSASGSMIVASVDRVSQ